MTQEEYFKSDQLMAMYLGFDLFASENVGLPEEFKYLDYNAWYEGKAVCTKFKESWDWLMPVIYKIYQSDEYIKYKNTSGQFTKSIEIYPGNILKTYHEVAEFIIWYNKNNKND